MRLFKPVREEPAACISPIGPWERILRLLGTAIRANVDLGRRVFIAAEGPSWERKSLAARGYGWRPWVWARSGNGKAAGAALDAAQAWNELFQNPRASSASEGTRCRNPGPRLPHIHRAALWRWPPRKGPKGRRCDEIRLHANGADLESYPRAQGADGLAGSEAPGPWDPYSQGRRGIRRQRRWQSR